jgi:HAL2 family 3'(2'),5'-bisphosphate nucleotidase
MLDLNNPEVQFALEAVRQASGLVRQVQRELTPSALLKSDRSPVTVADFASQALVARLLEAAFPDDPLVAEEDSRTLRSPQGAETLDKVTAFVRQRFTTVGPEAVCEWIDRGGQAPERRFWTLDPIDGTKGFLRGDQYVVALALVIDGRVQIGALGCPNLAEARRVESDGPGSLVIAARGQGTWAAPLDDASALASAASFTRLHVSERSDPSQARLLRSVESGHTNVNQTEAFIRTLGVQAPPTLMDSQAKYALLAAGEGDLLLRLLSPEQPDYREKIWDQAAGSLILEESGGCISDQDGRALDFGVGRTLEHNRGVLATNQRLHPAALDALRAIGA